MLFIDFRKHQQKILHENIILLLIQFIIMNILYSIILVST